MNKITELKIILSNCLNGGTAWNDINSELSQNLFSELSNIDGLEFKKINSNNVRGEHNSFTIIINGVFYNDTQNLSRDITSKMLEYIRNATNRISELTYSEIRIEYTRSWRFF